MIEKVSRTLKNDLNFSKEVIVKHQLGSAALTAVKQAILRVPGTPENVKAFIDENPYADLAIGAVISIACELAPVENRKVAKLSGAVSFASAISASAELTTINDLIEAGIDMLFHSAGLDDLLTFSGEPVYGDKAND